MTGIAAHGKQLSYSIDIWQSLALYRKSEKLCLLKSLSIGRVRQNKLNIVNNQLELHTYDSFHSKVLNACCMNCIAYVNGGFVILCRFFF